MNNLTESQRCYLEAMVRGPLSVLDINSGGAQQCIQRLLRKGLVVYVSMQDWRDGTYQITDAGRGALSHQIRRSPSHEPARHRQR